MTHSTLEANRRRRSQQRPYTHREGGGSSKHTNGIAACIARDTERQIQSNGCQLSRARDLRPVLTRRAHTHPSHQSTSTAPSQPDVWPCQMTYDTQHFGGGALSNGHSTQRGREQQAHKQHRSMHCKRQRDGSKAMGVNTLGKRLTCCPHQTHTHTPIPPIHQSSSTSTQHQSQPAVWYR
eukprot:COSAG06_NODE_4051_length_4630_cov_10.994262_1_plen_180_part_00